MKPEKINEMTLRFVSRSANEGFARAAAAAFIAQLDPTVEQLIDVKTAVSEAVTNAIVHGYPGHLGPVKLTLAFYETGLVKITVADKGCGIEDVQKAMQPLYTTGDPELRAGLGFAVLQNFTDKLAVHSTPGKGTRVVLYKQLGRPE